MCRLVRLLFCQVHHRVKYLPSPRLWWGRRKRDLAWALRTLLKLLCQLLGVDLLALFLEGLVGLEVLEVPVPRDVDEPGLLCNHRLHSVCKVHRGFVRASHLWVKVPYVADNSPARQEVVNMLYKRLFSRIPERITEYFTTVNSKQNNITT